MATKRCQRYRQETALRRTVSNGGTALDIASNGEMSTKRSNGAVNKRLGTADGDQTAQTAPSTNGVATDGTNGGTALDIASERQLLTKRWSGAVT